MNKKRHRYACINPRCRTEGESNLDYGIPHMRCAKCKDPLLPFMEDLKDDLRSDLASTPAFFKKNKQKA